MQSTSAVHNTPNASPNNNVDDVQIIQPEGILQTPTVAHHSSQPIAERQVEDQTGCISWLKRCMNPQASAEVSVASQESLEGVPTGVIGAALMLHIERDFQTQLKELLKPEAPTPIHIRKPLECIRTYHNPRILYKMLAFTGDASLKYVFPVLAALMFIGFSVGWWTGELANFLYWIGFGIAFAIVLSLPFAAIAVQGVRSACLKAKHYRAVKQLDRNDHKTVAERYKALISVDPAVALLALTVYLKMKPKQEALTEANQDIMSQQAQLYNSCYNALTSLGVTQKMMVEIQSNPSAQECVNQLAQRFEIPSRYAKLPEGLEGLRFEEAVLADTQNLVLQDAAV